MNPPNQFCKHVKAVCEMRLLCVAVTVSQLWKERTEKHTPRMQRQSQCCVRLCRKTEENEQLKHDQRLLYQGIVWKSSLTFFYMSGPGLCSCWPGRQTQKPLWADILNRTSRLMLLYEKQIVSFLHYELEHSETDWPHFSVGFPLHHYGPTWQQWKTCCTV